MTQLPIRSDDRLEQILLDAWPPVRWRDTGVVVGCSGGADSVALLCGLGQIASGPPAAKGFLVAAHFNHRLRGEASDGDQAFVAELAEQMNIRFVCEQAVCTVGDETKSDEASLRGDRMAFLVGTAKRLGCRYIALAHSSDDNAETVLHHLLRGSGPMGIAGISPFRSIDDDLVLARPLISMGRAQIRESLRAMGQTWREDQSNAVSDYQRNWIRNELIPMIRTRYPDATGAIVRAAEVQQDWRRVIEMAAKDWMATNLITEQPLEIRRGGKTDSAIVIAALQSLWDKNGWPRGSMTRDHWQRLAQTLADPSDQRYTIPGKIDVLAREGSVRFSVCSL